jgi:hypothetical protein
MSAGTIRQNADQSALVAKIDTLLELEYHLMSLFIAAKAASDPSKLLDSLSCLHLTKPKTHTTTVEFLRKVN